jgi:hypothetical protein
MNASRVSPAHAMNLDKKDWIAGLDKGLAILQTFDEHAPPRDVTC